MTPELLSRQTRQTRLALLVFSTIAASLYFYNGAIVASGGINIFGITLKFESGDIHTMLTILIGYLLVSFFVSAVSDRHGVGLTPKEQAIAHRIERLKDSFKRIEQGQRVKTIQTLLRNQGPFKVAANALNKIYDVNFVSDDRISKFDHTVDLAQGQTDSRLEELALSLNEFRSLEIVDISLGETHSNYCYARSKGFAIDQHLLSNEQMELASRNFDNELAEKYQNAQRYCNSIKRIATEIVRTIEEELDGNADYTRRLIQLEQDNEKAFETTQFSIKPRISWHFLHDVILDIAFPLILGSLGFFAALRLS